MTADTFHHRAIRHYTCELSGRRFELIGPADPYAMLDEPAVQQRFDVDEFLPYWAHLWPASVMLAEHVLTERPDGGGTALEIGCGLGLAGLAAAAAGWRVTLADYDPEALAFAAENARRNGLDPVRCRLLDWREPPGSRWALILGADVLYEQRDRAPIAAFIHASLADAGVALLCDPNRHTAVGFDEELGRYELRWTTVAASTDQPSGRHVDGTIYRIRR